MNCRTRQLSVFGRPGIRLYRALVLALAGPLLLMACRPAPPAGQPESKPGAPQPETGDRLRVFVSIPPQADFVQRIGGDRVQVDVLVGPGQNPHSFEATPAQVSALAKARVFFRIGMPFEDGLLPRLRGAFKQLEIVDTQQGVPMRPIEGHVCTHEHADAHDEDESHGHHEGHGEHGEGETAHQHPDAGGDDPHTWLNPRLVKIQARTIADTLARLDPPHADEYQRNLAAFEAELDGLDARIAAALAPVRGKSLFVYHPAFGYFADAYGLHQVPVEIAGKEPAPRDVTELIRRARQEGVRVIFVQPQFSTRNAEIIARQINGAVVPLDDLAPDYMKSMENMADQVRHALSEPAGSNASEPESAPEFNESATGAMPKRSSAGVPTTTTTTPAEP